MIEGILIEGLIYGILVLGVFITFRVLDFADMTVDGSFPLGAAVAAVLLTKGVPSAAAILAAFGCGSLAGLVTAVIHAKLKVPGLLAGILTMTMLYSVNLRVMSNRANVSLLRVPTLFSAVRAFAEPFMNPDIALFLFLLAAAFLVKFLLDLFFHTDLGLAMGALGSNPQMVTSQGMNPQIIKAIGISLANALAGAAGALACMYQGFADASLGTGMVVAALASLMIGEFLLRSNKIGVLTLRALLGSVVYRAIMYAGRKYGYLVGLTANDLKLITGLLIIACLIISRRGLFGGASLFSFLKPAAPKAAAKNTVGASGASDKGKNT